MLTKAWRLTRITPAHAGNTFLIINATHNHKDHPRACGEYKSKRVSRDQSRGSPPRMRGIPTGSAGGHTHYGITPAHAGNTRGVGPLIMACRDHPRACGEYPRRRSPYNGVSGSPPRMRGIPLHVAPSYLMGGITPAHAGNTRLALSAVPLQEDHPRACGEYCNGYVRRSPYVGSPPRMRGIPPKQL